MTTAVTLAAAAGLAWDNANVHWIANQLQNTSINFYVAALPVFGEADVNSHPVSNWLTIIANQANLMASTNVPIDQLSAIAQSVYRVCWMGQFLLTAGQISTGQGADLLAAYNATFGAP